MCGLHTLEAGGNALDSDVVNAIRVQGSAYAISTTASAAAAASGSCNPNGTKPECADLVLIWRPGDTTSHATPSPLELRDTLGSRVMFFVVIFLVL